MTTHELKTLPPFFDAVWDGRKRFELRRDDRGFTAGDTIHLKEWDADKGYSGRIAFGVVTYVLRAEQHEGLMPGYCILSFYVTRLGREEAP